MYIGHPVKYLLSLSDFNETCIFYGQIFNKDSNIKFHENTSSGNQVVPCGQVDRHGKANSCFFQFFEHAKNGKSLTTVIVK